MPDVSDVAEIVHGEARVGMVLQAVSEVQRVVLDPDALRKDDQLEARGLFEGFPCGLAGGVLYRCSRTVACPLGGRRGPACGACPRTCQNDAGDVKGRFHRSV